MPADHDRCWHSNLTTYINYYCSVLAGHSVVHVSPHNKSLRLFDDVSSNSSWHAWGCTWYQNNSRNVQHVMCVKLFIHVSIGNQQTTATELSIIQCTIQFLQRSTQLAFQALYMLRQICLSILLLVRPSVTLQYCVRTREGRGMQSSPSGSSASIVFWREEWLLEDDLVQVKFECKEVGRLWKQPSCTHLPS